MARGSGSSGGSYRQWAAAERAAQREREQRKKQAEKDRLAAEAAARDKEAVAKTDAVEQRVAELESLLRSSLPGSPHSLRLTENLRGHSASRSRTAGESGSRTRMGRLRARAADRAGADVRRRPALSGFVRTAERAFADAQADYHDGKPPGSAASRRPVQSGPKQRTRRSARPTRTTRRSPRSRRASGCTYRFAVSGYVQMVLDRSPYPEGFPAERHAGYVPESTLLAVEWFLPTFDIIPGTRRSSTSRRARPSSPSPGPQRRRSGFTPP